MTSKHPPFPDIQPWVLPEVSPWARPIAPPESIQQRTSRALRKSFLVVGSIVCIIFVGWSVWNSCNHRTLGPPSNHHDVQGESNLQQHNDSVSITSVWNGKAAENWKDKVFCNVIGSEPDKWSGKWKGEAATSWIDAWQKVTGGDLQCAVSHDGTQTLKPHKADRGGHVVVQGELLSPPVYNSGIVRLVPLCQEHNSLEYEGVRFKSTKVAAVILDKYCTDGKGNKFGCTLHGGSKKC